jgi:hypothetical protein
MKWGIGFGGDNTPGELRSSNPRVLNTSIKFAQISAAENSGFNIPNKRDRI